MTTLASQIYRPANAPPPVTAEDIIEFNSRPRNPINNNVEVNNSAVPAKVAPAITPIVLRIGCPPPAASEPDVTSLKELASCLGNNEEDNIKYSLICAIFNQTEKYVADFLNVKCGAYVKISGGKYFFWDSEKKLWSKTNCDKLKRYLSDTIFDCAGTLLDQEKITEEDELKIKCFRNKICTKRMRDDVFSVFRGYITDDEFIDKLDPVNDWIPTNDGRLISIKNLASRDRVPTDLYTYVVNAKYDVSMPPEKYSTMFNYFLQVMNGNKEMTYFLLQRLGIYISGSISDKSFMIFYGPRGDNGKSKLIRLFESLLGPAFHSASNGVFFSLGTQNANSHTSHLNSLFGKRLSVLSESNGTQTVNATQIKALTGDDTMPIRRLQHEEERMRVTTHSILVTNDLPQIVATESMRERCIVVPFNAKFLRGVEKAYTDEEGSNVFPAIENINEVLSTQDNLDALFFLVMTLGAQYYSKTNILPIPDCVKLATSNFIDSNFPYAEFIAENCDEGPDFKIKASELYEEYRSTIRGKCESRNDFYSNIRSKYAIRISTGKVNWCFGLRLKEHSSTDELTKQLGGRPKLQPPPPPPQPPNPLSNPPGTVAI